MGKRWMMIRMEPCRKRRVFGGVVKSLSPDGETLYAVVKGRATGRWSFPKGHAKKEETPESCVRREIEEEIGLKNVEVNLSKKIRLSSGYYFGVNLSVPHPLQPMDHHEVMEARWVTREELSTLCANKGIQEYLTRKRGL
jgi:8-oxo-dGTP pyrophosphatase MutT (NUDIX family)